MDTNPVAPLSRTPLISPKTTSLPWYASLELGQQRTSGHSWVSNAVFLNIAMIVISKVQKRKAALLKCVPAFKILRTETT